MSYSVVEARGVKVRVVAVHSERRDALKHMYSMSSGVVTVQNAKGRIVASNVARSF